MQIAIRLNLKFRQIILEGKGEEESEQLSRNTKRIWRFKVDEITQREKIFKFCEKYSNIEKYS